MSKITDASSTQILLANESTYGVMPKPFVGLEFGINGEGLAPNITTVESEELNLNPDLIDNIISGVDAGGDLNYEVCEGAGMRMILEHAFRGSWAMVGTVNTLKSGAQNKSMTIIKKFSSDNGDFPFAYTGSRLNSLSFEITADGGIITSTVNFMSKDEKYLGNFGFFHKAGVPAYPNVLGNVGDLLVIDSTREVYIKNDVAWVKMLNPHTGTALILNITGITASSAVPTVSSVAGTWLHLRTTTGQWYISNNGALPSNAFLPIVGMITTQDNEGVWRTGTTIPSNTLGSYGDYYVVTGTWVSGGLIGKTYQKMSRELNAPWVEVANMAGSGFSPSSMYYYNMSITAKSLSTKMHIPQFKNIVITGVGASGTYCFTDLGFTIENNCKNVKGFCTKRTEADFPWLSAVETKYGSRKISGNATLLFNSVELYEDFFKKNKTMSLSFSMENGEGKGWTFTFPKVKFSEGSINAGAKGENIVVPLKWVALYDSASACACQVTEQLAAKDEGLPAPLAQGATNIGTSEFEANWGFVEGALGYKLDIAEDPDFNTFLEDDTNVYEDFDIPSGATLSQFVSDVTDPMSDRIFYYRVRAYNNTDLSENSNVIAVSTLVEAIYMENGNPTDDGFDLEVALSADVEYSHIRYSIYDSQDEDRVPLENYNDIEFIPPIDEAIVTVTGLEPQTTYYVVAYGIGAVTGGLTGTIALIPITTLASGH